MLLFKNQTSWTQALFWYLNFVENFVVYYTPHMLLNNDFQDELPEKEDPSEEPEFFHFSHGWFGYKFVGDNIDKKC